MNSVKHVAIIMDGNGRWGIKHRKSRNLGHKEGLKAVEKIIKTTIKNKIKYLTLYAFSTENWKRPKKEINFLLKLLENFLLNKISDLKKQNEIDFCFFFNGSSLRDMLQKFGCRGGWRCSLKLSLEIKNGFCFLKC